MFRGGMLSESVHGRTWHTARDHALGPDLAAAPLARRPYDLRHAALSLWLNATGAPAQVAARAGNSVRVLHAVYPRCLRGQEDVVSRQIEEALHRACPSLPVTASGPPNRLLCPDPVRYMSVIMGSVEHATAYRGGLPRPIERADGAGPGGIFSQVSRA
jgi:hypothetical protein